MKLPLPFRFTSVAICTPLAAAAQAHTVVVVVRGAETNFALPNAEVLDLGAGTRRFTSPTGEVRFTASAGELRIRVR